MCFSTESSMFTFLIASCCTLYLYKRNYTYGRTLALIFFSVALMQLSEFIMWSDLNCGSINNFGSKCAFIVLCMEPLVATFAVYYMVPARYPRNI